MLQNYRPATVPGGYISHKGCAMYKIFMLLLVLALANAARAEKPFDEQLAAAEQGDLTAMLATGTAYYRGDSVERDCYEARRWLKKSAAAGAAVAYYLIGVMDDDGMCGIGRAERAVEYYRLAAAKHHAGAQYRLGELYRTGRGVDQDMALAIQWLEAAAGQGEPRADCSLARIYFKGGEVPKNRQKALRRLRRGLESHDAEAVALCHEIRVADSEP